MKTKLPPYSAKIFWSAEDERFVATCAEFPGLSGLGETREGALEELGTALELVADELKASGEEPPKPLMPSSASGQFRLRLPKSLHARLADIAELERVSLNTLAVSLLAEGVGERSEPSGGLATFRRRVVPP